MASKRQEPTATDYLITALSPVLIMLMVGSFVFFLVEVLYEGEYTERLLYTLFFFVVAAVLIARISIEFGAGRAGLYALALGVVTWLALQAYVQSSQVSSGVGRGLIHFGLLLLIWWCAHKLTWDCTYLDERQRGSGRGILAAAGWGADGSETPSSPVAAASAGTPIQQAKLAAQESDPAWTAGNRLSAPPKRRRRPVAGDSRLWAWIEAYQKHREQQQKRPHTPGVWVLYCFLVALPIFALGQSLIDPADHDRRRATFWQMAVFTGSALSLLATTSLLGLRRYLRQRHARIPLALSSGWLLLAGGLILVFLVVGAFLPRPHSETPWFGWQRVGSPNREASRYAVLRDSAGRGEGAAGRQIKYGEGQVSSPNSGQGTAPGNSEKGSPSAGKSSSTSHSSSTQPGSDQRPSSGRRTSDTTGESKREESQGERPRPSSKREGIPVSGEQQREADGYAEKGAASTPDAVSSFSAPLVRLAGIARWLVFAVVAVVVIGVVLLGVLRGLAPFTAWANRLLAALQQWWARWWSRWGSDRQRSGQDERTMAPLLLRRPPPWTSFSNPYEDGSADEQDVRELVDYTLLAWEAWAYEQGCPRADSQTAWEFLTQLEQQVPEAAEVLRQFAALHAQVVYGDQPLPLRQVHAILRQVWEVLSLLPAPEAQATA
ncbi:MAG: DUF4129 domain-containing protein [Thermogemmata sp.]